MRNLGRLLAVLFIAFTALSFKNVRVYADTSLPTMVQIEKPDPSVLKNAKTVDISGWAVGEDGIRCVRIYLDGEYVADAASGEERTDISTQYPDYQDSDKSGFVYTLDISTLSSGTHTITAEAESNDGNIAKTDKDIILGSLGTTYNGPSYLSYNTSLTGTGWGIEASSNKTSGTVSGTSVMDAFKIHLYSRVPGALVKYKAYVRGTGWQSWKCNNAVSGNAGSGKVIEAVKVSMEGLPANYHVVYQVYLKGIGWQNIVHDGQLAGLINEGTYVQAIKVKIANLNDGTYRASNFKLKFAIDIGHNNPHDSGARGYRIEDNLTREVGSKVISKLKALGYTVVSTLPATATSQLNSLQQRVYTSNINEADRFVSIHFNFGGGQGSEVYAYSSTSDSFAKNVLNQLAILGYQNRGIKHANYYVLKHTNAKAILVEGAFVDSQSDMARYNGEKMAQAIVNGLVKEK